MGDRIIGRPQSTSFSNAVLFYNGLYFALRSAEQRPQEKPLPYEIIEQEGRMPYLKYNEVVKSLQCNMTISKHSVCKVRIVGFQLQ